MIPVIVLTAGLGTRLDPLTRLVAKPAVPFRGRTIIEHVLEWLRGQGVTDAVLNLHHKPESITGAVGDGAHLGLRIRYSWEGRVLGSAGGPKRAISLLDADRVAIVNGDTLCAIDLAAMLAEHARSGAEATLAVVPNPSPAHYNGIVMDDDARFTAIIPKGQATPDTWHFVGVQIVDAKIFSAIDAGVPAETTSGLYLDMMRSRPGSVRGWRVAAPFIDVGTPRDYLTACLAGVPETRRRHDAPEARGPSTVVWPDATVSPTARLHECIVAGPVVVPPEFRALRSVIVPASVRRSDERVPVVDGLALFPL